MQPTQRGSGRRWAGGDRDRDIQDRVIRYLTDSGLRSASKGEVFLDWNEAKRAERFSYFLARRYYRDRLNRGFRHSAALLRAENAAVNLADSMTFDSILQTCILGSLATARTVGALVLSELRGRRSEEWWSELLEYEFAFFVQIATSEPTPICRFLQHGISTTTREFRFAIPEVLENLKEGEAPTNAPRKPTTLLFSRTHHGRIYVVELDPTAIAVMEAVNGSRQVAEIAESAGLPQEETDRVLADLIRISAVLSPVQ